MMQKSPMLEGIRVRAPLAFTKAAEAAASKSGQSLSEWVRGVLEERLRAEGLFTDAERSAMSHYARRQERMVA